MRTKSFVVDNSQEGTIGSKNLLHLLALYAVNTPLPPKWTVKPDGPSTKILGRTWCLPFSFSQSSKSVLGAESNNGNSGGTKWSSPNAPSNPFSFSTPPKTPTSPAKSEFEFKLDPTLEEKFATPFQSPSSANNTSFPNNPFWLPSPTKSSVQTSEKTPTFAEKDTAKDAATSENSFPPVSGNPFSTISPSGVMKEDKNSQENRSTMINKSYAEGSKSVVDAEKSLISLEVFTEQSFTEVFE